LLQRLSERHEAGLVCLIVRGTYEHTDTPHAVGLLRPCQMRPCSRTTEKRDELAPSH